MEAIEILERWVEYRPKSTLALSELAKAYESNNEFTKAIPALARASEISSEWSMEESNGYQTRIDQLKKKMAKKRN